MKKLLSILLLILSVSATAQPIDTLKLITSLQKEVSTLKVSISRLQQEDARLNLLGLTHSNTLDSLKDVSKTQEESLHTLAKEIGAEISGANKKIEENTSTLSDSIKKRSLTGLLAILFTLVLFIIAYGILRGKISKSSSAITKIKEAQNSLDSAQKAMQEESVKLDNKLMELLDNQLKVEKESSDDDHSLVKSIATEVARIEQNLLFMDAKTKGVSNLKNRASAIKSTLQSKGYDIPTLVGETYHEGDNIVPTMELDEELPAGTNVIRRVMKPMILYKGKLIQAAEVVVAYNE